MSYCNIKSVTLVSWKVYIIYLFLYPGFEIFMQDMI